MRADLPALRAHWLPPGCDHFSPTDPGGDLLADLPATGRRVVYTGSAAWAPSRDATVYLLGEVWPRVLGQVPDAHLVVAGSGQVQAELGLAEVDPSVRLCGALPSLGPLLHSADVFVCPVRFGGGVKSKILESLHAGCAIASTPAGVRGLPAEARQAVLVAATADDLAAAVVRLLLDDRLRADAGARAARAAAGLPTWDQATRRLDAAWSDVMATAPPGGARPTDRPTDQPSRRHPISA
jgi:glycosyltransferase involved in cell wall biosynthesis